MLDISLDQVIINGGNKVWINIIHAFTNYCWMYFKDLKVIQIR